MDEKIDELIQALRDPETCLQASWELAKMGSQIVDAVIDTLIGEGYKDNSVGVYSCIVLGKIRDLQAVQPLLDTLKQNPYWEVRRRAAWALGEIKDQRAVDPLIDALTGDTNPDVRAFSAAALGELGNKRALRALIQALDDLEPTDDYSLVCYSAISALGCIGGPQAVDALLKILKSGIPSSLEDFGASAITTLLSGLSGGGVVSLTYSEVARSLAAQGLGEIGDKKVLCNLSILMERERSKCVSNAIKKAIQAIEERQEGLSDK